VLLLEIVYLLTQLAPVLTGYSVKLSTERMLLDMEMGANWEQLSHILGFPLGLSSK